MCNCFYGIYYSGHLENVYQLSPLTFEATINSAILRITFWIPGEILYLRQTSSPNSSCQMRVISAIIIYRPQKDGNLCFGCLSAWELNLGLPARRNTDGHTDARTHGRTDTRTHGRHYSVGALTNWSGQTYNWRPWAENTTSHRLSVIVKITQL